MFCSLNSLDQNDVDEKAPDETIPRDYVEEREVTMDMYGEDMDTDSDPLALVLQKFNNDTNINRNSDASIDSRYNNYGYEYDNLETTEV